MGKIIKGLLIAGSMLALVGCTASFDRTITDVKSNWQGGLNRTINIYTADGKLLKTYEGKIDIDTNDGGYVKFDFDGKRYVYFNCYVETIADK